MSKHFVDVVQNGFRPVRDSGLTIHDIDHLIDMNLSVRRDLKDPSHIQENKTFVDTLLEMRFAITGANRPGGPKIQTILYSR